MILKIVFHADSLKVQKMSVFCGALPARVRDGMAEG